MVATNTGYSAYILQVEPVKGFSGSIFKSLSGYVRILDLKRSTQSEAYFENGNQVNAAGKNGRINTLYTGCECVYAIKPVIGPIGGDDISDEAGYDVWIDCTCNSGGGGGATQGGNGDQGGIGTPIGGESPSGDRGGKGGIAQGGGGVGEVLGFEDLEPCPQGTWSKTGGCCPYGTDNEGLCLTQQAYELIQLLKADPLALLEIPCEQIPKWKEIAQHRLPKEIVDKIKNLDDNYLSIISGDWNIQYIEDASGPTVNLDYFPVNIYALPKDPSTGQPFTPEGFFNYVRKNLNKFLEGNSTEFGPYNAAEATIWNSSSYLSAIMRFDILIQNDLGLVVGQQDGSVICSYQDPVVWRFTTIESPRDWNHPVSGTREFGMKSNPDGTFAFYTRGVDRVAESTDEFFGNLPTMNTAFEGGDALWSAFQNNLENYVNDRNNGGVAKKATPSIYRPDWSKVKDVLQGKRPMLDLGCQ